MSTYPARGPAPGEIDPWTINSAVGGFGPAHPPHPSPKYTGVEIAAIIATALALILQFIIVVIEVADTANISEGPYLSPFYTLMTRLTFNPYPYLLIIGLVQLFRRHPTGALIALICPTVSGIFFFASTTLLGNSNPIAISPWAEPVQIAMLGASATAGVLSILAGPRVPESRPMTVSLGIGANLFLIVSLMTELGWVLFTHIKFTSFFDDTQPAVWELGPGLHWTLSFSGGTHSNPDGIPLIPALIVVTAILILSAIAVVGGAALKKHRLFLIGTIGAISIDILTHIAILVLRGGIPELQDLERLPSVYSMLEPIVVLALALAVLGPSATRWFAQEQARQTPPALVAPGQQPPAFPAGPAPR